MKQDGYSKGTLIHSLVTEVDHKNDLHECTSYIGLWTCWLNNYEYKFTTWNYEYINGIFNEIKFQNVLLLLAFLAFFFKLDWKGPKLLHMNEVEERFFIFYFLSRRFCIALNKPSNIASSQLVSEASFFFAWGALSWNRQTDLKQRETAIFAANTSTQFVSQTLDSRLLLRREIV